MRIGVVSDTHIPDRANDLPKKLCIDFNKVDMILHAGDFTDKVILDKFMSFNKEFKAVCGNMDSTEIRRRFPQKQIIKVEKIKIGLIHGYGAPNVLIQKLSEEFKDSDVQAVVFGHAHFPTNEIKDGILFFNPGSPTDKVFAPFNSYGILDITGSAIKGQIIKI